MGELELLTDEIRRVITAPYAVWLKVRRDGLYTLVIVQNAELFILSLSMAAIALGLATVCIARSNGY